MQDSKKVLVTGANGHVGNNLVKALVDRGYWVRASVRDSKDSRKTGNLPLADIVVLTSSAVTVPMVETGGRATTEDDWRTDFSSPYHRAKTLAEQEAWQLAKEHRLRIDHARRPQDGCARCQFPRRCAAIKGKAWTMSNARAKGELGWRQQIPLEQSLADTMITLRRLRTGFDAPQPQALEVS